MHTRGSISPINTFRQSDKGKKRREKRIHRSAKTILGLLLAFALAGCMETRGTANQTATTDALTKSTPSTQVAETPSRSAPSIPSATPTPSPKKTPILIPPPKRNVPGQRFQIAPRRELFVPDFFRPGTENSTPIVIHFLGAAWCTEQCFYDAHLNAVLLTVNHTSSSDYPTMGTQLPSLLKATRAKLSEAGIADKPLGPICLSSFSGGYTAVRDILRHPELVQRISDVVLADSLYCPRVPGHENELQPGPMEPFLRYARRAADGGPSFWFSQLFPPEAKYRTNTTTLAAYYLTDKLGIKRRPATGTNSRGARLLYRADRRNFHVLGYAGMTTQDHFEHLYSIADLLKQTSLPKAP